MEQFVERNALESQVRLAALVDDADGVLIDRDAIFLFQPGQFVSRGFPQVLCDQPAKIESGSSGRLELARWIGSEDNPLTARVMVNRIWKHLIGQGIVTSTENFGVTGQAPSHPELPRIG